MAFKLKRLLHIVVMTSAALSLLSTSCEARPPEQLENTPATLAESWQIGENWRYSHQSIWLDTLVATDGENIIAYNLKTKETQNLKEIPADYLVESPSIYEDKLVWSSVYYSQEARMSRQQNVDALNWDVFLLDLKTGEERQITTNERAQISPGIYGDTIVWLDNRHEQDTEYPHSYDVYAYNLKTGIERRITATSTITEKDLSISGSLVVWTDNRNDDPASRIQTRPPVHNDDIYLYDLSADRERRVTTDAAEDFSPVIDGGRIVWKRLAAVRNIDIFLYDINAGQETKISQSRYVAPYYYPAIYSDRVVWADSRITLGNADDDTGGIDISGNAASGAAEIYLYDLGTKRETLLVPSIGTKFTGESGPKGTYYQVLLNPVMHGDYVVYTDTRQVSSITYATRLRETFPLVLELSNQKTTLQSAGKAIGRVVPIPTYLPAGYQIKEIYLQPMKSAPPSVILLISDIPIEKRLVTHTDAAGTRQRYELQSRMIMYIRWTENGIIVPPDKDPKLRGLVEINKNRGYLSGDDDSVSLWWALKPKVNSVALFELHVIANNDVSEEELVRIAESVTVR